MPGELPTPEGAIYKDYYVPVGPRFSPGLDSAVAQIETDFLDGLGEPNDEPISFPAPATAMEQGEQGKIIDGFFIPGERLPLLGILTSEQVASLEF